MITTDACTTCHHRHCAQKVALFENLPEDALEKITGLIQRRFFLKGDSVFTEGQIFDKLYIVNGGSLKIFRYSKEGREQILYVLGDGDFIGDINLFKKDILPFSGQALEDTHLCIIAKDDFDRLLQDHPQLTSAILESAYDRIKSLETLVQTLSVKDTDTRLAALLVKLAENFGIHTADGIEIHLNLTREEMASFIGMTRETVSRKLSGFQQRGLITLRDDKTLVVLDMDSLEAMSIL